MSCGMHRNNFSPRTTGLISNICRNAEAGRLIFAPDFFSTGNNLTQWTFAYIPQSINLQTQANYRSLQSMVKFLTQF